MEDSPGYIIINEAIREVGLGNYEGAPESIASKVIEELEANETFTALLDTTETVEDALRKPLGPKEKKIVARIARRVMRSLAKGNVIYDE